MNYSRFSCIIDLYLYAIIWRYSNGISQHPIILIIAYDGFRYDYISRGLTPVLEELQKNGTSTQFMNNVFPTVTSPNFFSIATGLYAETHGVLGNVNFNEHFKCLKDNDSTYELFHYNDDIVPLWLLNEKSGEGKHSGTICWPGSQFEYNHKNSTFFLHNSTLSLQDRVETAVKWILDEKTPANLVFLYFGEPDSTGHRYGPDSENVNNELRILDNATGYLLTKLTEHRLRDKVNLIFLSDHGMAGRPKENTIDLSPYVNNETFMLCGESPIWYIKFKPGYEEEVYNNLTQAKNELKTFVIYRQAEIPERWHIKHCRRIGDLVLLANTSYVFPDASEDLGEHGYDITEPKMRPFFIANGPLFKIKSTVQPFNNIDIYPLIMKMLDLKSLPDHVKPNGTVATIQNILRN